MTPDGVAACARRTERADRRDRGARARGGRGRPAARLPPSGARAARSARRSRPRCRTSTCRSRTTSSARFASSSAQRRRRSTPRSRRCWRATCGRLLERAAERRPARAPIMQSSGGLAAASARRPPRRVHGALGPGGRCRCRRAHRSPQRPSSDLVCFDMGGTSCDVCVVEDGAVRETAGREVGGRPLALPMVDIHTVGAGGGSIAWRDPGGALRVGPRSAGAIPGPACYGRGGERADGHGRQPPARSAQRRRDPCGRRRARPCGGTACGRHAGDRARPRAARLRRRHRAGRRRRDDPRAAPDDRRTGNRPAWVRAVGVRRGGPTACRRDRRRARNARRSSVREPRAC